MKKRSYNYCEQYGIPCPFALGGLGKSASLPCIGTFQSCKDWRDYYTSLKLNPSKRQTRKEKR